MPRNTRLTTTTNSKQNLEDNENGGLEEVGNIGADMDSKKLESAVSVTTAVKDTKEETDVGGYGWETAHGKDMIDVKGKGGDELKGKSNGGEGSSKEDSKGDKEEYSFDMVSGKIQDHQAVAEKKEENKTKAKAIVTGGIGEAGKEKYDAIMSHVQEFLSRLLQDSDQTKDVLFIDIGRPTLIEKDDACAFFDCMNTLSRNFIHVCVEMKPGEPVLQLLRPLFDG